LTEGQRQELTRDVAFLAPVQQPDSALSVEVANIPDKFSVAGFVGYGWPALFAVAIWIYGWRTRRGWFQTTGWVLGWLLLGWAALRCPNGAGAFLMIIAAFSAVHVVVPALRQLWRLPRQPEPERARGASPAAAAVVISGLVWWGCGSGALAAAERPGVASAREVQGPSRAESVTQDISVEDRFVLGRAKIRWQAEKGEILPLIFEPAVLTGASYPSNALTLEQSFVGGKRGQQLSAKRSGAFEIEVRYELQAEKREGESGFTVPVPYGLVNRVKLTVVNLDVDVRSLQAASSQREASGSNTVATVVLSPASDTWVGWKPRSRDVKREKPVYYAEISQLYVPTAGVIEGAHHVAIRPAQGELNELVLEVPAGATITDVLDPAKPVAQAEAGTPKGQTRPASLVSLWRFDPDTRKLRVTLSPAQSRPFALLIRSQVATGPLPFEQAVGLVSVENAAGQIGLLGVATGERSAARGDQRAQFLADQSRRFPR
jgi:hypothetical protein